MTMGSGFPPFSEFGPGILHLFRGKAGTGFNLPHDFLGPMNITTMPAVNLGQFEPQIQIPGLFLDFLFQNFNGRAEITLGQKFINGFRRGGNLFRLGFSLAPFADRTAGKFHVGG